MLKRFSYTLFLIVAGLFFNLALTIATSQAQVPVLKASAKLQPQGKERKVPAGRAEFVTLGDRGNIKKVKTRPDSSGTSWLPNVRRKISSKSAIIIDAGTGKTLFAKSADTPRQPASTIKVLTGMIALKSLEENDWVSVSSYASRMPRSKVYLDTEKKYTADDLINAVLLASANDASVALAEQIAGSETDFARMMTLRAQLWGAKNTVCRTATGLTAKGQHSTARDLALIFRHAMQDDEFVRRMKKAKIRTSYGKLLRNHNKALWRIDGAEGGKTGYTRAARQTYVGQFSRDEGAIIVAIMGSETMWTDIRNLVEYGFSRKKHLAGRKAVSKGSKVALAE